MDIIDYIIDEDKKDYQCYALLKNLLTNNRDFALLIEEGIRDGKISKFPEELWDKMRNQNIRRINSFEDVFKDGANIGYCTVASKQLSYSLDNCDICGGILPLLANTPNCPDGRHTWISYQNNIIDTSLMLIINEQFAKKLGYQEENRYNPNQDPIYSSTKEWTNDSSIRKSNSR